MRLNGEYPKIGIRIIVDGRRNGVREALEDKTTKLAQLVAQLVNRNLFYSDGSSVNTVLSPTGIGGVAEAVRTSQIFKKENVCATIDVTYAWAYASEIIEMDPHLPKAIWGFNGSERPGSVYLAGAIAACEQKGLPVFKIYGKDVQDKDDISIPKDVAAKILKFAKSAVAVGTIKDKSYLSMGGVSMGIGGSIVNPDIFQDYFGMRNEFVDMTEFVRRIEQRIYDIDEYEKALRWVQAHCKEMKDPNPIEIQESEEQKDENWETVIEMTLIARDLIQGNKKLAEMGYIEESEGHNAIAAGFQGQRNWTDYFPNGDFMEAILNTSFDWNGIREPYIVATENDSLNAMSMLFGFLLTGKAQIFADVRTYWSIHAIKNVCKRIPNNLDSDGFLYLTNSGAAALDGSGVMHENGKYVIKEHWNVSEEDVHNCLEATRWGSGKLASFRGGGFSSSFKSKGGMPMTMLRLNLVRGLGPVLQLAEGNTIEFEKDIEEKIITRTDPTWPKTFFVPILNEEGIFTSVYNVMESWGSNHCSICHGHIGDMIITLAAMLRIPVAMHNVDRERIFRPSFWKNFGTLGLESADFRACQTLGPLYR